MTGGRLFHNPVDVRFGRGVLREALAGLPRPVLVVAGRRTLARCGLDAWAREGDGVLVAPAVPPRPGPSEVDACLHAAAAAEPCTVLGLGGGAALDVGKIVAALHGHAGCLDAWRARAAGGELLARRVRLVQAPTTAGTGSEVTPWASLWHPDGSKSSFDDRAAYADLALIDPSLSDGLPARLTAATGLDALSHAAEALWSVHATPAAGALAERALALVARHLLPCVRAARAQEVSGGAAPAPLATHRDGMALAATLAGLALSQTRTAAAHALSYGLTGRFGLEHGLAVGLAVRALLPCQARLAPEPVARVCAALGVRDAAAAQRRIDEVLAAAGLAPSLHRFGIPPSAHGDLVAQAAAADRLANNPGPPERADLLAALESIA